MRKIFIILLIPLVLIITIFTFQSLKPIDQKTMKTVVVEEEKPTEKNQINSSASFEIYTNGTRRIFTADMYHNQSEDVYIENENPNVIQIKKSGTTWDDFFKTLPFSLTSDCLTTGTGQIFCTNENENLKFFINGVESPDALDRKINPNDNLEVIYGN